jgi:hypothetical protein
MSRSNVPPTNKKSVKCPDCGKWITLQGYGGHRRFYHGEYQKDLKRQLFKRSVASQKAGKISPSVCMAMTPIVGAGSKSTMQEILEVKHFLDSLP